MEGIENIRKNVTCEIKEKVKKNPKYLHPANKERLEDMKRLMFTSGNEFTQWMQKNGIMNNPTDINLKYKERKIKNANCKTEYEYKNKCAKNAGFKDHSERHMTYMGNIVPPLSELNEDCPLWFGNFTENIMIYNYRGASKMPTHNRGFDYLWGDVKIDNKGACLEYYPGGSRWKYDIRHNNIADVFIISGWDNRESLKPLLALEFKKNDLVRYGNYAYIEFWKRYTFTITNRQKYLKELKDYQIDISWLKELCDNEILYFKIEED